MARVHVYDDVPDSFQLKILNPEVYLLQSTAVWHVFSFSSVSRLGEQPLQGSEDVLVCALRGSIRDAPSTIRDAPSSEEYPVPGNDSCGRSSCCTFVLLKASDVENPVVCVCVFITAVPITKLFVGWQVELSHAMGVRLIFLRLECSQTSSFIVRH
jgi:hypothetical protein